MDRSGTSDALNVTPSFDFPVPHRQNVPTLALWPICSPAPQKISDPTAVSQSPKHKLPCAEIARFQKLPGFFQEGQRQAPEYDVCGFAESESSWTVLVSGAACAVGATGSRPTREKRPELSGSRYLATGLGWAGLS